MYVICISQQMVRNIIIKALDLNICMKVLIYFAKSNSMMPDHWSVGHTAGTQQQYI